MVVHGEMCKHIPVWDEKGIQKEAARSQIPYVFRRKYGNVYHFGMKRHPKGGRHIAATIGVSHKDKETYTGLE